jgi:hypothetical protein
MLKLTTQYGFHELFLNFSQHDKVQNNTNYEKILLKSVVLSIALTKPGTISDS